MRIRALLIALFIISLAPTIQAQTCTPLPTATPFACDGGPFYVTEGFESGTGDVETCNNGAGSIARLPGTCHGGVWALQADPPGSGGAAGGILLEYRVVPGRSYTASAYWYGASTYTTMYYSFTNADCNDCGACSYSLSGMSSQGGNDDWQEVSVVLQPTGSVVCFRMVPSGSGGQVMFVDDLTLTENNPPTCTPTQTPTPTPTPTYFAGLKGFQAYFDDWNVNNDVHGGWINWAPFDDDADAMEPLYRAGFRYMRTMVKLNVLEDFATVADF